jgi:hypothetical protein
MGQSAAWRAHGDPSPAHERSAHTDFARYAASAAFNSLEHTRYRQARALDAHHATPLDQRGAMWRAVDDELQQE